MTFEEASTYPQAAIIALQSLRDKGQIQPGQRVLIHGAGGGMGSFAVQIAKYYGAEVTGVDSTRKLDMLRSIGIFSITRGKLGIRPRSAECQFAGACFNQARQ